MKLVRMLTTRLRAVPGGIILANLLRSMVGHRSETVTIDDFEGDLTMFLDLDEHMQSQIYWYGSYNREIAALLRRVLKPGMTVFDVGANIGELTLVSAKLVGPSGTVVSFEPVKRFAEHLEKHVAANRFTSVRLVQAGLSDAPGEATIYVSQEVDPDGTRNDGLGTLFPTAQRSQAEQTVQLMTLDQAASEIKGRVDLIKIDIEGGEYKALLGGRELLQRDRPDIVLELAEDSCTAAGYRMEDVLNYLGELGYKFWTIGRNGRLTALSAATLGSFQNAYCVHGQKARV